MTYQTQQIKPAHYSKIKKLPIPNQKKVIEETGQPFEPIKALQVIKDASEDYTVENTEALEVDGLIMDWLNQGGFSMDDPAPKPNQKQAKELNKQDYQDAIAGLQVMLDLASGDERSQYEDAIAGLRVMIDLL